jgi:hypothetical protein
MDTHQSVTPQRSGRFAVLKLLNFRYCCGATIFSISGEHIENVIRLANSFTVAASAATVAFLR